MKHKIATQGLPFLVMAFFQLSLLPLFAQQATPATQPDAILVAVRVVGTGRTTGHIADMSMTNRSDKPVRVEPQRFYIPAREGTQDYVARLPDNLLVPPRSTVEIPLEGYCADVHTPPVPAGDPMPPVADWLPVGDRIRPTGVIVTGPETGPGGAVSVETVRILPTPAVPRFDPDDIPGISGSPGFTKVEAPPGETIITWPDTDVPVGGTFTPRDDPRTYARIVVEAVDRIEEAFDRLQGTGVLKTPFSGNPDKERESVIQQTFWIFTAALTGDDYERDDFAGKVYDQFADNTGASVSKLPEEEKQKLDSGIDDFWNTFQATGAEAKVLVAAEPMKSSGNLIDIQMGYCRDVEKVQVHQATATCKPNCSSCPLTTSEHDWLTWLYNLVNDPVNCGSFVPRDLDQFCETISLMMERILAIEDRSERTLNYDYALGVAWRKWCQEWYMGKTPATPTVKGTGSSTIDVHQRPEGTWEKVWWPSGICVDDLSTLEQTINAYAAADGRIRTFRWTGHGGEAAAPCKTHPDGKGTCDVSLTNTTLSMKKLAELLKFRTDRGNCEIIINSCYMGNPECADIMQSLANETGCTVRAPKGRTTPTNSPDDSWSSYSPQEHAGPSRWDRIE